MLLRFIPISTSFFVCLTAHWDVCPVLHCKNSINDEGQETLILSVREQLKFTGFVWECFDVEVFVKVRIKFRFVLFVCLLLFLFAIKNCLPVSKCFLKE